MEDLREKLPNKFIQQVVLPTWYELAAGEWLVDSNRLLSASQKPSSSLSGSGVSHGQMNSTEYIGRRRKLTVDDPKEPAWKRYFVKMTESEALETAPTFPAQFTVPEHSQLKIFVEH